MSTQWHPLFARLLGVLLEEYYEVKTEVPVSDLPRKGDIILIRRQDGPEPPFRGLWNHLTDWNVLEFKGPTDYPEEDDLELLLAVGAGLAYTTNEERKKRCQERLPNRQVSFWYIAPTLGNAFLEQARARASLTYETGGLWSGKVWGHPLWLVASRDVVVEEDTVPLHLLDRNPPAPRSLGELVVRQPDLLRRYAAFVSALQPEVWKEIRLMAGTTGIIDWEAVDKVENLDQVIRFLPPERIIQVLGVERAIEVIGPQRVIDTLGLQKVIAGVGAETLLAELLKTIPAEQVQELLRRGQEQK